VSHLHDLIKTLCPAGVEFKHLGDVARIRNGRDYKYLGDGDVPVYGTGGVMTTVDTPAYTKPSVLIPRKGSLHKLYFVDVPFWTVDTIFYTEIGDQLVPKFFYYYLLTQHLENLNQAGGVPSLTQSVLNELRMPVPPLDLQREIVRSLDSFQALEAELEAQLGAELEARRAQYAIIGMCSSLSPAMTKSSGSQWARSASSSVVADSQRTTSLTLEFQVSITVKSIRTTERLHQRLFRMCARISAANCDMRNQETL
jgi:hypothetical protein